MIRTDVGVEYQQGSAGLQLVRQTHLLLTVTIGGAVHLFGLDMVKMELFTDVYRVQRPGYSTTRRFGTFRAGQLGGCRSD